MNTELGAQGGIGNVAHGKALAEAQGEVPGGALAIENDLDCSHTYNVYYMPYCAILSVFCFIIKIIHRYT